MTKWTTTLLALLVLVAVSVHASPITNDGATNKVMARQEGTAPSAEVVTAAPAAPPAAAAAEEEDDDDDDDDDDYDLTGGIDDDDDDDDDEAEDDDDDDDDYIERFFDDILADDDDDDDEKPAKPSTPAVAVVTSAPTVAAAVIPEGEGNAVTTAPDDDYDEDDEDEDASTEGQQRPALGETDDDDTDDDDEEEEEEDDEAAEKDEGDDDEDDDDNDLADDDDDDDTDLLDSDEDIDDVVSAKSARALGAKSPKMPAAHLSKYNRFVDSIIGRINDVLKKSFDPVTVRLTRGSPPPSRRPVKSDPKHNTNAKIGEEGPTYELVAVSRNEDLPLARSSTDNVETPSVVPAVRRSKHARRNKNKANKQNNRQRARATLIGLASLRRDGDVTVNSMSEHTTVRSRFLLGPLVLRVEKQFGRGAKKELRSATATTDKMTGRMVLRVNSEGVAKLHSIRVLQPKQVRVESEDNHDRTREFVWRRSSHIASLVSQKLTKAARDLLQTKPEPAERQ